MSIRDTFSNSIDLALINEYDKRWFHEDLNSAWVRLPFCFSKGPLKRDFSGIYQTTFWESVISEIQNLWGLCFFPKRSNLELDIKKAAKNQKKVFCFSDNFIWIGIVNLSLLRTGYFSWTANVLTSSPKIFHVNKRDFFQLNWIDGDQWIWYRWCDPDLNSSWGRLPCCLSKGPLKRDFLDIYIITFLESVTWEIQNLWGSSFFSKRSQFKPDVKKAAKNEKKFFVSEKNPSEFVSLKSLY